MEILKQLLVEEEGRVNHAYTDSLGYMTLGVGHLVDPRKGGRVSDKVVDQILAEDIEEKSQQAALLKGFEALNEVQKAAVVSMVFQLGLGGVLGFPEFCKALAQGDAARAAQEGLNSKWARSDSPTRAAREMKMLSSGVWVPHAV